MACSSGSSRMPDYPSSSWCPRRCGSVSRRHSGGRILASPTILVSLASAHVRRGGRGMSRILECEEERRMRTQVGLALATFGSLSRERRMPSPQRALRASSRGNHMRALSGLLLLITLPTATSAAAQWTHSVAKDEMTNQQVVSSISPHATPSRPMEVPYTDTDAWVGFMCDGKNEWVYLGF